jgi:hypothetical protein
MLGPRLERGLLFFVSTFRTNTIQRKVNLPTSNFSSVDTFEMLQRNAIPHTSWSGDVVS